MPNKTELTEFLIREFPQTRCTVEAVGDRAARSSTNSVSRSFDQADPSKLHKALLDWKCRLLFSSSSHRRNPGPKGPSAALIAAILEMKRRNPRFGCVRMAQQISHAFGVQIDKDVVRRILARCYRPGSGIQGPPWLSFIGHAKGSLWSIDLLRCESVLLRSRWVMLVWMSSPAVSSGSASNPPTSMVARYARCSIVSAPARA